MGEAQVCFVLGLVSPVKGNPSTVHCDKFVGLVALWVANAHGNRKLAQNSAFKFLHVVPCLGVHVQQRFICCIDSLIAIARPRFGAVALLVFLHGAPAFQLRQDGAHERDGFVE